MRILVTGATGFVGRTLLFTLRRHGFAVRAVSRSAPSTHLAACDADWVRISDIGPDTEWLPVLDGVSAVVHLAGRVHVMHGIDSESLAAYRRVNVQGTRALATAAMRSGVKRMVFVSSVKVNGEQTFGRPFRESDVPCPKDSYAVSKWEAEQALAEIAYGGPLEKVVLRCPLVYGPGVGANFLRLLRLADSGLPLPLASIENQRSMIAVNNLADAIVTALCAQQAAGGTFLLSDGDWATPELIRGLASALGRPARLFSCPHNLLRSMFSLVRQSEVADRLLQSLQVDSSRFRALGWCPSVSREDALEQVARWYRHAAL